jgi:outer membrane receptor protein involved in Fe transport
VPITISALTGERINELGVSDLDELSNYVPPPQHPGAERHRRRRRRDQPDVGPSSPNLFGNVAYLDGGFDEDQSFAPAFSGARFRLQPKRQAAGGFTVDAPVGNGMRVFATPRATYRSRIFFELPNNPLISQDAVTLVNVRGGVSFANERFELAAFLRNALDEDYLLDAGNTGGGFGVPTFIPAEPRFYGLQLTASFR